MSDQDEIKILVKKPDGSFVHLPLSEVQKRNRLTPSASAPATKPDSSTVKSATTQPVSNTVKQAITQPVPSSVKSTGVPKPVPANGSTFVPSASPKPMEKVVAPPVNLPIEKQTESEIKKTEVKLTAPANQKPVVVSPSTSPVKQVEKKPQFDPKENIRLEKEVPVVVKPEVAKKVEPVKPVAKQATPEKMQNVSPRAPEKSAAPKIAEVQHKVVVEKGDMGSLLEEELPMVNKIAPLTSESREKQVEEILKNISFRIPPGNNSRVKTIVQMFLKEIRGEVETLEILRRPEIEGGVGLSEDQAREVLERCKKTALPASVSTAVPALKGSAKIVVPIPNGLASVQSVKLVAEATNENKRLEAELPAKIEKTDVNSKGPAAQQNNNLIQKPALETKKTEVIGDARKMLEEQITKATMTEMAPSFKINSDRTRTTMHDVQSAPIQMGPVDEIRYMSLVDFRRLSTVPDEAAARLKQKFLNLREESIVLYFEALDAWKVSPIYHDYINLVSEALKKHLALNRVTADKSRIQLPEIFSLVKMEKELG